MSFSHVSISHTDALNTVMCQKVTCKQNNCLITTELESASLIYSSQVQQKFELKDMANAFLVKMFIF